VTLRHQSTMSGALNLGLGTVVLRFLPDLLAALDGPRPGPRVAVVRAMTGLRGVGRRTWPRRMPGLGWPSGGG
jgi:hypothetical protein